MILMSRNIKRVGPDCQSGRRTEARRNRAYSAAVKPLTTKAGRLCPAIGNSCRNLTTLLCFLILACVSTKARGATNEVVDALPPSAQASGVSAAASKSPEATPALQTQQGARDPFWPIGYMPGGTVVPAKTNATESVRENISPGTSLSEMLKIGGVIRKGGKFYATINGFTVQTGEVVAAVSGGEVYKFVIEIIDFEKVQVRPVGRVPLPLPRSARR